MSVSKYFFVQLEPDGFPYPHRNAVLSVSKGMLAPLSTYFAKNTVVGATIGAEP